MPPVQPGLPGELQKFSFENSADLHWKLYWEIERLQAATPDNPIDMKCHAFNAAVTAWQLTEWVFADMTQAQKAKRGIATIVDLQTLARTQCRAVHICRQIATASKHRFVDRHYDLGVSTSLELTPGKQGQPGKWSLVVVDGGVARDAIEVFEEARLYWYKLLCSLGLIL